MLYFSNHNLFVSSQYGILPRMLASRVHGHHQCRSRCYGKLDALWCGRCSLQASLPPRSSHIRHAIAVLSFHCFSKTPTRSHSQNVCWCGLITHQRFTRGWHTRPNGPTSCISHSRSPSHKGRGRRHRNCACDCTRGGGFGMARGDRITGFQRTEGMD